MQRPVEPTAAFYRKTAADLIQRFPEIVEPLRDGRLCLTAMAEVARVITPENRAEVLPRFFHCSSREAKQVAAEIAPVESPPMREVVTAIRSDRSPQRTVQAHEPAQSEIASAE
ncbi:MAG TPA: HNH endonuclease, partial [Thermoanaerobaculia bacterium]|nr:HNH endonuclease [Thermoanaerobaculia bacterium]